jgi:OTU domain-containing protein 3
MGKQKANKSAISSKKEDRITKQAYRKQKNKSIHSYDTREEVQFLEMMHSLGLTVRLVRGDGNCMFRAIADQLSGDQECYMSFREKIMDYIESRQDHFSLFMEDDEKFEVYLDRMRQDTEWGGQAELYAAAQVLACTIVVHQVDAPRYIIECEDLKSQRKIHISYHGECHYNSVRNITDGNSLAAALPIDLTRVAVVSVKSDTSPTNISTHSSDKQKLVLQAIPWATANDILAALELASDEVSDAIEMLVSNPNGLVDMLNCLKVNDHPVEAENHNVTTYSDINDQVLTLSSSHGSGVEEESIKAAANKEAKGSKKGVTQLKRVVPKHPMSKKVHCLDTALS